MKPGDTPFDGWHWLTFGKPRQGNDPGGPVVAGVEHGVTGRSKGYPRDLQSLSMPERFIAGWVSSGAVLRDAFAHSGAFLMRAVACDSGCFVLCGRLRAFSEAGDKGTSRRYSHLSVIAIPVTQWRPQSVLIAWRLLFEAGLGEPDVEHVNDKDQAAFKDLRAVRRLRVALHSDAQSLGMDYAWRAMPGRSAAITLPLSEPSQMKKAVEDYVALLEDLEISASQACTMSLALGLSPNVTFATGAIAVRDGKTDAIENTLVADPQSPSRDIREEGRRDGVLWGVDPAGEVHWPLLFVPSIWAPLALTTWPPHRPSRGTVTPEITRLIPVQLKGEADLANILVQLPYGETLDVPYLLQLQYIHLGTSQEMFLNRVSAVLGRLRRSDQDDFAAKVADVVTRLGLSDVIGSQAAFEAVIKRHMVDEHPG